MVNLGTTTAYGKNDMVLEIGTVIVGADISTDGEGLAAVDLEGPVGSLGVGGKIIA
ncbi:MAG TPA: hypothetical protein VIG41_11505 [Micrococcaceae bacterium]